MADDLPEGFTLIGPESIPVPEGATDVPAGFTEIMSESPKQKLQREFEHTPFVTGMSEETFEAVMDKAPAAIGGIGAGILTGGVGLIPALSATFLGGATGEGLKDLYNTYYNPDKAPKGEKEVINSIVDAGKTEAFAELTGRSMIWVAGKGYHFFRPKLKGGVGELQKEFSKFGGRFTQQQSTDAWLVEQMDSITRSSLTGKNVMFAADISNDAALKKWQAELSRRIASDARTHMSEPDFGALMSDTIGGGQAAFKKYVRTLYEGFDDLVKTDVRTVLQAKKVPSSIVDVGGKPLMTEQIEKIVTEFRPVDVRPIKEAANKLSLRLREGGNLARSEFGGETIEKLLNLDDALKFSTAQEVRSTLLDLSRAARRNGDAKLSGTLTKYSAMMSEAMDQAAKNQSKATLLKYSRIKNEARKGYTSFNSRLIHDLLAEDANLEKFSDVLFQPGNSRRISELKVALRRAAKHDKRINPTKVMGQVKQKYLEHILDQSTLRLPLEPTDTLASVQGKQGVPIGRNLTEFFEVGHKNSTMNQILTQAEQDELLKLGKALELTQTGSEAGLSMLFQLGQGAVVARAASRPEPGTLATAAGMLLPTKYLAHMMTNPTAVKLLTSAARTPTTAKQAPIIAQKMWLLIDNAKNEVEGKKTLQEDVGEFVEGKADAVFEGGRALGGNIVDRFTQTFKDQPASEEMKQKAKDLFGPFDRVFGGG